MRAREQLIKRELFNYGGGELSNINTRKGVVGEGRFSPPPSDTLEEGKKEKKELIIMKKEFICGALSMTKICFSANFIIFLYEKKKYQN